MLTITPTSYDFGLALARPASSTESRVAFVAIDVRDPDNPAVRPMNAGDRPMAASRAPAGS
jgi:hypothetical protein